MLPLQTGSTLDPMESVSDPFGTITLTDSVPDPLSNIPDPFGSTLYPYWQHSEPLLAAFRTFTIPDPYPFLTLPIFVECCQKGPETLQVRIRNSRVWTLAAFQTLWRLQNVARARAGLGS